MDLIHHVGVDLGGMTLAAAVVDMASGEVIGRHEVPTQARQGPQAVIARMAELIETVMAAAGLTREQTCGVGIGVPGVLDMKRGLTLFLPNLLGTWPQVPLKAAIEASVGLPTSLLNDVRAFTLGEKTFGAGRDLDNIVCLAVGTGVGGGVVINGQLYLGIGGTAGEVGHQIIDPYGPPCGCGSRGCLEAFASGPAITAMALKAITQGITTRITEMVEYDLNRVNPELICRAAREGDPVAQDIYERAGFYLGIGVANLIAVLSPEMVIIGGGVARAGELLFEPVRRTVRERVHVTPIEQVQIVPAQLGTNAGLVGAAVWAARQAVPTGRR
jgi:glucokinase